MDNDTLLNSPPNNFNWAVGQTNSWTSIEGSANIITQAGSNVLVKKRPGMPVSIFFGLMKKKMGVLKDYSYKKRIEKLEATVEEANKNGQIAFSEELMKKLFVLLKEAEMWACGKKIFLERAHFDEFRSKTTRPVSLTPLKNYARPIPDSVLKEKKKCDDLKLYDGYAVMHYDDGKTIKETEKDKQIRREKDPILFGIVQYSSRLYFVDDWEDEFCDLTLDDIVDKLQLSDEDTTMKKEITI